MTYLSTKAVNKYKQGNLTTQFMDDMNNAKPMAVDLYKLGVVCDQLRIG
jgi:hypothetical protein